MLIYAHKKKSYFHYKSLIKLQDNILSNCALKKFSIEINFLCILLFYEFLMYFFDFSTFCFYCFFAEICCSHFLKQFSSVQFSLFGI